MTAPESTPATVLTALEGDVLTVTLHRPESAHARNQRMRDELAAIWRDVAADDAIRAVVLTGSGDRHFCAGMDLREAAAADETPAARGARMRRHRDIELLAALPQPTIAAVNGVALGGGFEMALACDVRIVAEEAHLGLPEVGLGLVPAGGGTQRLPRVIGYARALELVLTGRRLSAAEAVAWGVASRAVPRAGLLDCAHDLARVFARQPARAVRYGKELVRRSLDMPLTLGIDAEIDALLTLLASPDAFRPSNINAIVD